MRNMTPEESKMLAEFVRSEMATGESFVRSSALVSLAARLEAAQAQLEDAWIALCKQDWGAATQNVFDVRASVTKLVESVRGHSATGEHSNTPTPRA